MRILFFLLISISTFCQDFASIAKEAARITDVRLSREITTDIILRPADWNITPAKYAVKPGDRLILMGDRNEIELHDLIGTADKPIILTALSKTIVKGINPGGRVIQFINCKYVRITGDPAGNGEMNITIIGGAQGVDFRDLSTHVEADHLIIDVGYSGLNAKTDPSCDPKTWRGNFTLDGVYFHDNQITTKTGEGIYIGESHYQGVGAIQGGPCFNGATTAQEHEIKNVVVENNVFRNIGADGIQVGSCPSGAIIRYNQVSNFGTVDGYGQNAGIIVNPGTVAEVYGNVIDTGTGFGIQLQGPGGSYVHNNLVKNTGTGKGAGAGGVFAAVYPVAGLPIQVDYLIANNTFLNISKEGIEYYNPVTWRDNILLMKTGSVISKQGGNLGKLNRVGKNIELFGNPEQLKLDANYVPMEGSPAYGALADVGAFQSVKTIKEQGTVTIETTTGGGIKIFVVKPDGSKIMIWCNGCITN